MKKSNIGQKISAVLSFVMVFFVGIAAVSATLPLLENLKAISPTSSESVFEGGSSTSNSSGAGSSAGGITSSENSSEEITPCEEHVLTKGESLCSVCGMFLTKEDIIGRIGFFIPDVTVETDWLNGEEHFDTTYERFACPKLGLKLYVGATMWDKEQDKTYEVCFVPSSWSIKNSTIKVFSSDGEVLYDDMFLKENITFFPVHVEKEYPKEEDGAEPGDDWYWITTTVEYSALRKYEVKDVYTHDGTGKRVTVPEEEENALVQYFLDAFEIAE